MQKSALLSYGRKTLLGLLVATSIFFIFSSNESAEIVPPHLHVARTLLLNVAPKNNSYRHRPSTVTFPGVDGATQYQCHTDCSGLIDALFHLSYGYTRDDFEHWLRKKRALSSSYFRAISEEHGFTRISHIQNILPGDLLSYRLPAGSKNFGHVMLVNHLPQPLAPDSPPVIEGTRQWIVPIIDCTGKGHGIGDSRYLGNDHFQSGIGSGEFRIYTDREGLIVGCAWSASPSAKFYSTQNRPFVVGRLIPGFRP